MKQDKYYYKDGSILDYRDCNRVLHKEDGAAVEYANGDKIWYINGKRHREDGPAVEYANGDKEWLINNKLHREDGPAVEYTNGNKYWFLNNIEYSKESFKAKLEVVNNMSDIELITSPEWWIRKRVKCETR